MTEHKRRILSKVQAHPFRSLSGKRSRARKALFTVLRVYIRKSTPHSKGFKGDELCIYREQAISCPDCSFFSRRNIHRLILWIVVLPVRYSLGFPHNCNTKHIAEWKKANESKCREGKCSDSYDVRCLLSKPETISVAGPSIKTEPGMVDCWVETDMLPQCDESNVSRISDVIDARVNQNFLVVGSWLG